MLAASTVRRVVAAVCAAAIAGMIVSSVTDRTGAALTFGLIAAAAVACLMVATAVAPGERPSTAEDEAARVEGLVTDLVAQGAEEPVVRALVSAAVRLGRARGSGPAR